MEMNYIINSDQLGNDIHSKVYILQESNSGKKLIVKIYEESRHIYFINEKNILNLLNEFNMNNEKNFFVILKNLQYNQNMFKIPDEINNSNLEFLFFEYLSKLSLLDYINNIKEKIKEINVKFLCYELLLAIKNLHLNNICHNAINFSNIMFDDNFNPKIIHFSEANMIDDKIKLNDDLFNLGQILAKILTSGNFTSINYNKQTYKYIIYTNIGDKMIQLEESKFYDILRNSYNINLSPQFMDFFHILINAKKFKVVININDLIKHEWLNEVNNKDKIIENNFKKDFKNYYQIIIDNNEKDSKINLDIKDILEENRNEINIYREDLQRLKEKIIDGKIGNGINLENRKEKFKELQFKVLNLLGMKPRYQQEENVIIMKENLEKIEINRDNTFKEPNEKKEILLFETNLKKEEKNKEIKNFDNSNINKIKLINEENEEDLYINKNKYDSKLFKQNCNLENKKENKNLNDYRLNESNKLENLKFEGKNSLKPRKVYFNYLELNINNNENKDINKAKMNLIKKIKKEIKEKYDKTKIKVNFKNEKDFSFEIFFEIPPIYGNFDEIEFLDKKFQKKVLNFQKFNIKVELIEGNRNLFSNYKINQYYLIFNRVSLDKEDFYVQLKILKEIVKNSFQLND